MSQKNLWSIDQNVLSNILNLCDLLKGCKKNFYARKL